MNGLCDTCTRAKASRQATWRVVRDDVGNDGEPIALVVAEVCDEHRKLAGMMGERLERIGGPA